MKIQLYQYPHPYNAMLSISSDLDGTRSFDEYLELMRFLNTGERTRLGQGLSLQFSNSLYFSMPDTQFAYWNVPESERKSIRELIRAGFIDSLHSFGNSAISSEEIARSLDEFEYHQMRFPIWSNHEQVPSNLRSARKPTAHGDDPDSSLYHANRTLKHGVRYVILGQVTSVVGQETFSNPYRGMHISSKDLLRSTKQAMKLMAASVDSRFRAHRFNRILNDVCLADGNQVYEVLRANWHAKGVRVGCQAQQFHELMDRGRLKALARSQGAAVLYTHLGGLFRMDARRRAEIANSIAGISETMEDLGILVRTTADLLNYLNLREGLSFRIFENESPPRIDVSLRGVRMNRGDSLNTLYRSGLTTGVESLRRPAITVDGQSPEVDLEVQHDGRDSWRVKFPLQIRALRI